ncbi:hypothetical protein SAMN05444004_110129 [Jannaschia faecimaris]|uniref:Uncharacterized protein n=1 Tax=Jannaschia faecimaris TaxID=1244108 RepID=A0A1H3S4T1_9RHOB|nr:hypothetical protein SAMN05444004_110129 [Jannaschia faecimaris]
MSKSRLFFGSASALGFATVGFSAGAQGTEPVNLCDIRELTPPFVERLQRRSDYDDLFIRMAEVCPEAALALGDIATAAIGRPAVNGAIDDDGNVAGNSPGGSTPGGSGGTPGGSGGTPGGSGSTPGGSGGTPGGSGSTPGNSGSAPGNSGSTPGNSGSAPGNSGSAPGNSGSTRGNNGGGNGPEGGSPAASDNANQDEV